MPVTKALATLGLADGQKDITLGDRTNMVYMGSTVVYGRGRAVITATGMDTEMGKIATALSQAEDEQTPLQKKLGQLSKTLSWLVLAICAFIFVVSVWRAGSFDPGTLLSTFMVAVSLAVAAIPEGLATVVTIVLSIGVTRMSKRNAVIRKLTAVETLGCTQIICSDKTGTLTEGRFEVAELNAENGFDKESVLFYAACAESLSTHPIALSIVNGYGRETDGHAQNISETAGKGVSATVDGHAVLAGNALLMRELGIEFKETVTSGTTVYVAVDGKFAGSIVIKDKIKRDSAQAIARLKNTGVKNTVMLSGDNEAIAREVAEKTGLDAVYARLLPADKVERLEELLRKKTSGKTLVYVGDGLNDAPVLARADVGIAMGGVGSDSAIEAADVVIMTDEPMRVADAVWLSKKVRRIVYENIWFAIAVKVAVLLLSALGLATMWWAVFADVGVAFIAILNALRALSTEKRERKKAFKRK